MFNHLFRRVSTAPSPPRSKSNSNSNSKKRRRGRRPQPARKHQFQPLEHRIVLDALAWIGPNGAGGSGNWDVAANWLDSTTNTNRLPGSGDNVTIDTGTTAATITIQSAESISIGSLTTTANDTLSITGGSLTVTSGTSNLSGPLAMTGGSLTSSGTGTTLTASSSSTTVSDASLTAAGGASLSFPELTSYVSNGNSFQSQGTGSVLDVSALTSVIQQGPWNVNATGGGTLKLSGLATLAGTHGVNVTDTGGSTLVDGNLTSLSGVNATLDGSDPNVAAAWTSFTSGTLTIIGNSNSTGYSLTGLTDVDHSTLNANQGGQLALPDLTSYVSSTTGSTFQANGKGSVLDVSALASFTAQGGVTINAVSGGTLKLGSLTSLSGAFIDITDTGGSTLLNPNLTTLSGVSATLDGSDPNVASAWTSFKNGTLIVNGSLNATGGINGYNLPGLTDVDDSTLQANSGGQLALPNLASYDSNGTTFQANGTIKNGSGATVGSVLDVSGLVSVTQKGSWTINAFSGAELKLSSLTSVSSTRGININDNRGSTLLDGSLADLIGVNATFDGTDPHVADAWKSFTYGTLEIDGSPSGQPYSLPGLTDIDGSNLRAWFGGQLALPDLTSCTSNRGTTFLANGGGSVIDVSALTSLTEQGFQLQATSGGTLKFGALTSLANATITDTGGSTLLDAKLASLSGVTATLDGTDANVANAWASFVSGNLYITGGNNAYTLSALTDIDRSNLTVTSGGSLTLSGLSSYVSDRTTFHVDGTRSLLDISALTSVTEQDYWQLNASSGGTLKVSGLTSMSGSYLSDTGGSTMLFSALTDANIARLSVSGATLSFPLLTQGSIPLANGQSVTIQGTVVSMPGAGSSGAIINVPASQGLAIDLSSNGTLSGGTVLNVGEGSNATLDGGTYLGGLTFNVGQGATVGLTGQQAVNYGGTLSGSGAGAVQLSGGGFYPVVGGVTLNFPGSMFQWTGGAFFAALGDVTNEGTMNLAGPNDKGFFEDATLDNQGTIIQTGSGNLDLHSDSKTPTTLKIETGATYQIESDSGIDNVNGGTTALVNAGTIVKTASTGTSTLLINGALSNTGTIEADSGTLSLAPTSVAQVSGGTLTGGTWNALDGATLKFPSGTAVTNNAGNVTLGGAGAAIAGIAGLASNSGSVAFAGGATFTTTDGFTNSGSLTLGAGGTLNVSGNFTQTSTGMLNEQIGGSPASGLFGQAAITGAAALAGNFNVSLVNGYTPAQGQDYTVLKYASATGTFSTISGLPSGMTIDQSAAELDLNMPALGPDLAVASVTAPAAPVDGQSTTVNWQVDDPGTAANGSWVDSVYISPTPAITSNSILLGNVVHNGGLGAGDSYSASLTTAVPALMPGNYYILVETDSHFQVADTNRSNNTLRASTGEIVRLPPLTLGVPVSGAFTAADQDVYYQVTVPVGGALVVSLTSTASSGTTALYVSGGVLPTPYDFQEAALEPNQPNEALFIPQAFPGTYYILAHSVSGAAATAGYTIGAEQQQQGSSGPIGITAYSPSSGGNGGNVTIEIDGTNLIDVSATLTSGSTTINATSIDYVSASQIYATFNLASVETTISGVPSNHAVPAAPGDYTLAVQEGNSPPVTGPFTVVAANPGAANVALVTPQYVRSGRNGTIVVSYTNNTLNDLPAPLLTISSNNSYVLFSTPDDPNNYVSQAQVLGVVSNGPGGILRPGQTGQLTLNLLSNDTTNGDQIPVTVGQVESGQIIDWTAEEAALKPPSIPTAAWNVIYGNLTAVLAPIPDLGKAFGLGADIAGYTDFYVAALGQAASYLSGLGETPAEVSDVGRLWSFLVAQADADFPTATLASAVDASVPTPGSLPLAIDRSFASSIASRYTPGMFGLGWSSSWQTSLSSDSSGNVTINSGGASSYFVALPNGTYLDTAGEHGTLATSGGVFTFTDTSGTQYVFLTNGQLSYVQDTDGNRIALAYGTGAYPVALAYSNPNDSSEPTETLTLSYNSQGFVSQVADGTGNVWTYQYRGDQLASVTAPGNLTTSYAYDTGTNPETANALLSITNPDGSQQYFSYDPATGRLTGSAADANFSQDVVSYTYPGQGEVEIADAAGNSFVWYNELGAAARVQDANGGVSSSLFDSSGDLVRFTNAAGASYQYQYSPSGDLVQVVDPLGQVEKMTYGKLDSLTSVTDGSGNSTQYSYSPTGDLLSIAYADGTSQSFTYDPLGNLSETVLQNGDAIGYQYNAQGLTTQETFADKTSETFAYDPHGNLLTAQTFDAGGNLTGTTTMAYNAANELLSISYPSGLSLAFTYNTLGQRVKSVDESGFTVEYFYDSQGRLQKLADGSGNLIVQYTYNDLGELSQKQNGNGTSTVYGYAVGDLTSIVNYAPDNKTVNSSFTYTYNLVGEVTSMVSAAGTTTYGYDATGQLTQVDLPDGTSISYLYNAAGDRTETVTNGAVTNYSSNSVNEITQVGSATYSYDQNGNLHTVSDSSGTTTYNFNDLNQLVSITSPDGTMTGFQYSPLGFMVGASTTPAGGSASQTNYLVDPTGLGNVVGAYTGSGSLIADYTYGLGLVSQTGPSGTGYYDFDLTGNTIGITGAAGSYVNQYSYLPFGEASTIGTQQLPNPFTFASQFGVMQVEKNLFDMRARDYTVATAEFLSNDPIGLGGADANLRRYAGNGPVSYVDPTGLSYLNVIQTEYGPWEIHKASDLYGYNGDKAVTWGDYFGLKSDEAGLTRGNVTVFGDRFYTNPTVWVHEFTHVENYYTLTWQGTDDLSRRMDELLAYWMGYISGDPKQLNGVWEALNPFDRSVLHDAEKKPSLASATSQSANATNQTSHDPNAIIGPRGYGTQEFVPDKGVWPYTIDFENDGSVAAQDVTVTEQLDPSLDWSTLQLGSFGFGPINISVPAGLTQYQTTVAYQNVDGSSLDVVVMLDFNEQTGALTATFTSLDPLTGQPPNGVTDGFLPPDNASGIGEGFVQYTIQPKAGLATSTTIDQQATVVFDTNAPLNTDPAINTIDSGPPTSSVSALPAIENSSSFTVNWSGTDDPGGSGIASYTIYVSDDGGPFTAWLADTTLTSATYNGAFAHSYAFYSVATDNVGNVEPTPAAAQATTDVLPAIAATPLTITAVEGATFSDAVATFTDTDPTDTLSATITWNDGTTSPGTISGPDANGVFTVTASHTFAEETTNAAVSLAISDTFGVTATAADTANVSDPAVIATPLMISATEGTLAALNVATFTDPGGPEAAGDYSATINWGDGNASRGTIGGPDANGVFTVSGTNTYAEEGTYTASLTITHETAPAVSVSATTTVADAPLTGSTLATATGGVEGVTPASLANATFSDANSAAPAADFTVTAVNWGDGSTDSAGLSVSGGGGSYSIGGSHLYAEEGAYSITMVVSDDGGQTATITGSANVADAPLSVGPNFSLNAVEGLTVGPVTVATFADLGGPESASDYSAAINWGDGTSATSAMVLPNADGSFSVQGSHVYAEESAPGTPYTISVAITHENGVTANATASATVTDNVALLLLNPQSKASLNVTGNGQVELSGGGAAAIVDSASAAAVRASGNATVTAGEIDVTGSPGTSTSGNASLPGNVNSGIAAMSDPFIGLSVPAPSTSFAAVEATSGQVLTLEPGSFLGGISVSGGSVTLLPGVYYLDGGGLSVSGGSLCGQGVLIYNAPQHGSKDAISITGQGSVNLTAPTSGPDQGIAIAQDPSSNAPIVVSGGASLSVTGVIYAAGGSLNISGNAQLHLYGDAAAGASARAVVYDVSVSGGGLLSVDASQNAPLAAGAAANGPASTLTNASVFAVSGQPLANVVVATSGALSSSVSYTAAIDWGDGAPLGSGAVTQTSAGQYSITGSHVYAAPGTYQIVVTVEGSDGSVSHTVSTAVISDTAQEPDPTNQGAIELAIGGTTLNDAIDVGPGSTTGSIVVTISNASGTVIEGPFAPTGRIVVYEQSGNDAISITGSVTLPGWIYAGNGDDLLTAGGGPSVVVGGGGNDTLIAGSGRDILIGGGGADSLVGGSGDDLMIGGTTAYDANDIALAAILAEWASGDSLGERMADILGQNGSAGLNGDYFFMASGPNANVFDDDAVDSFIGGSGNNWLFGQFTQPAGTNDPIDTLTPGSGGITETETDAF